MIPKPEIYNTWVAWASDMIRALEDKEEPSSGVPPVDRLPAAGREYRGIILLLRDPAGDTVWVCIWNGAGYSWSQIAP